MPRQDSLRLHQPPDQGDLSILPCPLQLLPSARCGDRRYDRPSSLPSALGRCSWGQYHGPRCRDSLRCPPSAPGSERRRVKAPIPGSAEGRGVDAAGRRSERRVYRCQLRRIPLRRRAIRRPRSTSNHGPSRLGARDAHEQPWWSGLRRRTCRSRQQVLRGQSHHVDHQAQIIHRNAQKIKPWIAPIRSKAASGTDGAGSRTSSRRGLQRQERR